MKHRTSSAPAPSRCRAASTPALRRSRPSPRPAAAPSAGFLTPPRPELRAAHLDLEHHHGVRVDAMHAVGAVLRQMAIQAAAIDQQAFGAAEGERAPAMLEALLAGRAVGPGA